MNTVSKPRVKDFSRAPQSVIPHSRFDRSHGVKTAFDAGYLVPFYLDEVLPGDIWESCKAHILCRMTTPIVPIMDNIYLDTHFFFVPTRLIWSNFTKMMGERLSPADSIDYSVPQITFSSGIVSGDLADYLGIPITSNSITVNALPFRAYAKIWDDWFRVEQLSECIIKTSDDIGDSSESHTAGYWNQLRKRAKRADYFTTALPYPQLGEGVTLPIGTTAPVSLQKGSEVLSNFSLQSRYNTTSTATHYTVATTDKSITGPSQTSTAINGYSLVADLSTATAVTINSLRMAFQLQKLLEADARCGGMRYTEIVRQHFGTINPDARLQRSEYLGGSSQLLYTRPVAQTASSVAETDGAGVGYLGATTSGYSDGGRGFSKAFTEHGYIIGLVSIRTDQTYQTGLDRLWSRKGRYDFYWPTLAHIGEQAVMRKELFFSGQSGDERVFGYQERYAEYRYKPSQITGKLRSRATNGSLDFWHLAQSLNESVALNQSFIYENPPIERVIQIQGEPSFMMDAWIELICQRPIPVYGTPGLVDHF